MPSSYKSQESDLTRSGEGGDEEREPLTYSIAAAAGICLTVGCTVVLALGLIDIALSLLALLDAQSSLERGLLFRTIQFQAAVYFGQFGAGLFCGMLLLMLVELCRNLRGRR